MGALTPEQIVAADHAEWKKRALKAEAQVRTLRTLRGLVDIAFRANLEDEVNEARFAKDYPELSKALDDLFEEACHLDDLEKPFDFFDQRTTKLSTPVVVRRRKALGSVSTLAPGSAEAVIEVDEDAPPAAQAIGVLFQLVQLADMAAASTPGTEIPMVSPAWIQDRAPALLVLLLATGLANPALPVDVADVAALDAGTDGGTEA